MPAIQSQPCAQTEAAALRGGLRTLSTRPEDEGAGGICVERAEEACWWGASAQLFTASHPGQKTKLASLGASSHCLHAPQQTNLTPSRCCGGGSVLLILTPVAGLESTAPAEEAEEEAVASLSLVAMGKEERV